MGKNLLKTDSNHTSRGKFIAFEGLDGSGSSTQVDILAKRLNQAGIKTLVTKEPTNNIIGGLIRGLLTHQWQSSPEGFQLLFAADRAHHLKWEILPALEKGVWVITDRYLFSTIAFGSINLNKKWLEQINSNFPIPDLTFLLKVKPEVCLERIGKSRNGFEFFEQREKLEKTWRTYASLSREKKNRIELVNGEKPIEAISEKIYSIVTEKFKI